MWTETLSADDPRAVLWAVKLLQDGEVVALPTETVYGLAADALNPLAVAKIFEAKERPAFDPLICHLPDLDWLPRLTRVTGDASSELVVALIRRFWPGPLTLVLPKSSRVPDIVTSGLPHVALRMSANPAFQEIARKLNRPLAAPSANRFGRISPTTAEHVVAELDQRIQLVVDAGPTNYGLESTIVAIRQDTLHILRSGPVTREALAEFAPIAESAAPAVPEAPGQLASHYAPRTPMRLLGAATAAPLLHESRIGVLAWQAIPAGDFAAHEVLSPKGDLREAAATLFAKMRRLDEAGLELILAQPVPETGLGVAIMDRLRKAAAPRPA
ncbi:MAG TPA: L-threonylcarbamoyladenylate synthase [Chthoniobacteraceae bacterium]|jgi:L-threonylcarbamoyladenylate synthase|nr:L-threonylcarbamoyladenylate synthase [Chthoniobacteraceae bacterium]